MYSALHIMQWFSQVFDVFTPKIKRKFSIFTFYESKQMSLTQDLRWSLGRSIALKLQHQTDLLLCTINCFLQWDHLPNMAVGDLAFYYTLYLWWERELVVCAHNYPVETASLRYCPSLVDWNKHGANCHDCQQTIGVQDAILVYLPSNYYERNFANIWDIFWFRAIKLR